ncbi:hypothetical protein [Botrimarina colliarenosi]|uniref:hypothetical protein n=1 Tax=Botrimarina colliarenosi TaxID=2528001 RepID=UPI0018D39DD3|nr:hypothetical protein [Botrimarina colliarenosi]
MIHSAGFESPAYSTTFLGTGQLAGQSATTVDPGSNPVWLRQGSGGAATVQSAVVASGSQAVRVTRAANSDDRWAVPVPGTGSERFVSIEWEQYVQDSSPGSGFGPFFGIEAYDTATRIGMLGVDAATREVLYGDRADGLVPTPGGETVTLNEWHAFRIELDFSSDTFIGFVDNVQVVSTLFEFTGADQFTDADITAVAAGGDAGSRNQTGVAYFDNYIVRSGLRGDYNGDGVVNAADYTVWRDQNGASGLLLSAEADGDGVVGPADYQVWRDAYGGVSAAATAVPEPTAVAMVAMLVGSAARRRQR